MKRKIGPKKLLLLLDFDGTLTPIVRHPGLARLSPARKSILKRLARTPGIKIALISGRSLRDLKKRFGLAGAAYAGNHGLEIELNGKVFIQPAAQRFAKTLQDITAQLHRKLLIKGVLVEDKGLTASVHYRQVPERQTRTLRRLFNRTIKPWRKKVKITSGKKVLELRPPVAWHKGAAVRWIIKKLGLTGHLPVYIGDDRTDEDAFRALKGRGVTYFVGRGRTTADRHLADIGAVYRYLEGYIKP